LANLRQRMHSMFAKRWDNIHLHYAIVRPIMTYLWRPSQTALSYKKEGMFTKWQCAKSSSSAAVYTPVANFW